MDVGGEFGTNTGRRRRTGWLDLVMLRHAVRLNSLTEIGLTKLDVLDSLAELKVCAAYELDGKRFEHMPYHQTVMHNAKPVYKELEGWQCDLSGVREAKDLPKQAAAYIEMIEAEVGVPVKLVGVGPSREQYVKR